MSAVTWKAERTGQFASTVVEGGWLVEIRDAETGAVVVSKTVQVGDREAQFDLAAGRYVPRVARLDADGNELGADVGSETIIASTTTISISLPTEVVMS